MKERLVGDWLTKINERGYEVAFRQILLSKGLRIIRGGHSPIEHGKDILAIAKDGSVHAYQLKSGDFAQRDILKYHDQLKMLVETRPIHPRLPASFEYHPYLVTTGEFADPAISLVRELNAGWIARGLSALVLINGSELHVDLLALSSDFWPVEPPDVYRFRTLYLADGRGDFDPSQFAQFLIEILGNTKSGLDLERRVAAANIFVSYLLDEFTKHRDYWSIFQGWTMCAAEIAWAGESGNFEDKFWNDSFDIAKGESTAALDHLCGEILEKDSLRVRERELDELARTRNTIALAGAACWQLIAKGLPNFNQESFAKTIALLLDLTNRGRLFVWGEGAVPQFLILFWMLECAGKYVEANSLLIDMIEAVADRNARDSQMPLEDPYTNADECLVKMFSNVGYPQRPKGIQSYSLLPLIAIAVRRNLRLPLEHLWKKVSGVDVTWFEPSKPPEWLRWHCEEGREVLTTFNQPQSWKELCEIANLDRQEYLPQVLRNDATFGLLFLMAFPHRFSHRFVKHLDTLVTQLYRS
jgi:hypothetical protein